MSLLFALSLVAVAETTFAAESEQEAYVEFTQKIAPIQQQLYSKQMELEALYSSTQPDNAKAQQLFKEIGELQGQLFVARSELRTKIGDSVAPYGGMGMHHSGEFVQNAPRYDGSMGHGGGYMGHRGGMGHGRHHGGAW